MMMRSRRLRRGLVRALGSIRKGGSGFTEMPTTTQHGDFSGSTLTDWKGRMQRCYKSCFNMELQFFCIRN